MIVSSGLVKSTLFFGFSVPTTPWGKKKKKEEIREFCSRMIRKELAALLDPSAAAAARPPDRAAVEPPALVRPPVGHGLTPRTPPTATQRGRGPLASRGGAMGERVGRQRGEDVLGGAKRDKGGGTGGFRRISEDGEGRLWDDCFGPDE
ncbi:hypothetical protein EYF80_043614 [Liparis tanakae]|uniref:Uncharacterized protein n=1 Tax=Liparis tanakae TaxID=230148 RepID=A0A4Z2FZB5_9TELE|nr:hypothetical protein EYF80_043614 [Liparis tanakae]